LSIAEPLWSSGFRLRFDFSLGHSVSLSSGEICCANYVAMLKK
jgi:hypothetical protein